MSSSPADYIHPFSIVLETILNVNPDDPEQIKNIGIIVRAALREQGRNTPYSIQKIGKKIIEHALREVMEQGEYQTLFRQFADDPFRLAKILLKKDPDRFFDVFLVVWNLQAMLPEYVEIDPEALPLIHGNGGHRERPENGHDASPRAPAQDLIDRIKANIVYLDENDIFDMAIPFFKQQADKNKDGFRKGYETLLSLLDTNGVTDPENIKKIERVFDRFQALIEMQFGQFKPHLNRKNFPYITVRHAIKEMEKTQNSSNESRRLAYFDTRTGKTSLALLEPEYLKKKRVLYICPPDTIQTIMREYESYGGDLEKIYVARTEADIRNFTKNNAGKMYCLLPSSLIAQKVYSGQTANGNGAENGTDISDLDELIGSDENDPTRLAEDNEPNNQESGADIESLRGSVNATVLQLFEEWRPDYVAVDEARLFSGYICESDDLGSKMSKALIYLLNNPTSLGRNITVRLMDATPGDLPRHFYPLLSIMDPNQFPDPESARNAVGNQPYLLAEYFSKKTDRAAHHQVYNRPPVRVVPERESRVRMSAAQDALYQFAAHYSTRDILHRITLARIAVFNPVVLRPAFQRLLSDHPLEPDQFTACFDHTFQEWQKRNQTEAIPFDWDFIARFGTRDLLVHLFAFGPHSFQKHYANDEKKIKALSQLAQSTENLSCKAEHVIERLRGIVAQSKAGERHTKRIIVFSSFKKGHTQRLSLGDDDIQLELQNILADQIRRSVPEVNVYTLDGGLATRSRKDGLSARDNVRQSWRENEGINVLIAVGPATCQGIDLACDETGIEEIYLDIPMDSRQDYQIRSRTLGPNQTRRVTRQTLQAVSADGGPTIDAGIKELVGAKYLFRDLVCHGTSVPPSFEEAIQNRTAFLGDFCSTAEQAEQTEEAVTNGIREQIQQKLEPES